MSVEQLAGVILTGILVMEAVLRRYRGQKVGDIAQQVNEKTDSQTVILNKVHELVQPMSQDIRNVTAATQDTTRAIGRLDDRLTKQGDDHALQLKDLMARTTRGEQKIDDHTNQIGELKARVLLIKQAGAMRADDDLLPSEERKDKELS